MTVPGSQHRTVLVVGANGFLAGYIVAALERRSLKVLRGVRSPRGDAPNERYCDLVRMNEADWDLALAGVDAVVNVAGILRESGAQTFAQVHLEGPLALAKACIARGVSRFVQVSALGASKDGEFIASKHEFDARLQELPLSSVILRPSVVYAVSGSYGGTSLLRALAALPFAHWLPGDGRWRLQPVAAEDLGEVAARATTSEVTGIYEVGGPAVLSLRDYQTLWRRWLRIPGRHVIMVPEAFVSAQVWLSERFGSGPVGMTMWRMLRRGNVTRPDASASLQEAFGFAPRALDAVLATHPSQVQDRWQAQLYFLAPILRIAVVALWVISAVAGLLTPASEIERLVGGGALQPHELVALARAGGVLDGVLALWLVSGWRPRWAIALMAASVVAYTASLGVLAPASWLDPLGGLAKNLIVLPALAVLWVLMDRR